VSQTTQALVPSAPTYAYNLTLGVERMQEMGIRFYLTHGGPPATDAQKTQGLQLVATTGPWQMWEVDQGVPVASLSALPAVFEPELSNSDWTGVSTRYYTTPTFGRIPLAQTGPADWPTAGLKSLPKETPTDRAKVSKIQVEDGRISFHVENVGSPVWVRISDFPGWIAQGAEGPYRVTPNYMAVVPTSNDVVVTKERTSADWVGMLAFFTGLGLAVGLAVYDWMVRRGWPALPDDVEEWDADQDWDAGDLDDDETAEPSAADAEDEQRDLGESPKSPAEDGRAPVR
jgi:hypothetical protein